MANTGWTRLLNGRWELRGATGRWAIYDRDRDAWAAADLFSTLRDARLAAEELDAKVSR